MRSDNSPEVLHAILLHAPFPYGPDPSWGAALLDALPYARRLQLEGRSADARSASLAAIALLLRAAAQLERRIVRVRELRYDGDGRPTLELGPGFSISHTATRVGCLVARGAAPGLDLESIAADADATALRRLRRWTATEAVLKAAGAGVRRAGDVQLVARGRNAIARLDDRSYRLRQLELAPDVVAHVAATERLDVAIEECRIDDPATSAAVERSLGLAS